MKIFEENGRWLKGNLHTHSTLSDGKKTPEEVISLYRKNQYDFLALTDHRVRFGGYVQRQDGSRQSAGTVRSMAMAGGQTAEESLTGTEDYRFLVIPSTEFDRNYIAGTPESAYHITGIGLRDFISQDNSWTAQQIIDAVKNQGAFCTLAHPSWSLMSLEQVLAVHGYDAMEIWNTVSETGSGRGLSNVYADLVGSRGIYPLLTAVDDAHDYVVDYAGGWIMVQAEKNNWPLIHEALKRGRFYSTQGPAILGLDWDGQTLSARTSPLKTIRFVSNALYNPGRMVLPQSREGFVTEASYTLKENDRFVRMEGVDEAGKMCWTNFFVR